MMYATTEEPGYKDSICPQRLLRCSMLPLKRICRDEQSQNIAV